MQTRCMKSSVSLRLVRLLSSLLFFLSRLWTHQSFDIGLGSRLKTVLRDRAAADEAAKVLFDAQVRLSESSYALASLVHDHFITFGDEALPELYGVPPDMQHMFREVVRRDTNAAMLAYGEAKGVVERANARFEPATNDELWAPHLQALYDRMVTPVPDGDGMDFDDGADDEDVQNQAGPSNFAGSLNDK